MGALVLRTLIRKNQARTVAAKDLARLKNMWADDITLTFMGQPPIVGKQAVEQWYRAWFASVTEISEHPRNFALVRPYALGFTNTVLFETTGETVLLDGRKNVVVETGVIEFKRGKAQAIRIYVADPEGESAFLGTKQG